jgi:hypothetical protein
MRPIATRPASEVLVPSDLELTEIDELREWFCYVKPVGPSIKITVTAASAGHGFCVATTGTEVGPAEEIVCRSHQAL